MQYKEDDEIISIFLEETKDHLIILENGIIELENKITKTKQSLIESLFRAAHSIKAAANLLKLKKNFPKQIYAQQFSKNLDH